MKYEEKNSNRSAPITVGVTVFIQVLVALDCKPQEMVLKIFYICYLSFCGTFA